MTLHEIELFLLEHQLLAFLASIVCSIIISILAVVPSVFLTAFNIKVFGFIGGTAISLVGEALGAAVAFLLYRYGFQKWATHKASGHPKVERLLQARGKEAFLLVFSLRLLPFVPSSLVTLFAALGSISTLSFLLASTAGKIPALLLEAYSVYEVLQWSGSGKLILAISALALLFYVWKQLRK